MIQFLKNWTLPIAMLAGVIGYFILSQLASVFPSIKAPVFFLIDIFTPLLIFAQLLLVFCKIDPKDLRPVSWHGWLLAVQLGMCLVFVALLLYCPLGRFWRYVFEGGMVCFICPTATAAAVITGKLGGNAASLSTYTLLSNFLAAIAVPLLFPLIEPHEGLGFFQAFLVILGKVFPLLLFPFFIAMLLRWLLPSVHQRLRAMSGIAFYIWGLALVIVCGQTVRSLLHSEVPAYVKWTIALAALLACCVQFYWGKEIGTRYGERISAGQALGQKNTVLAIWMAYTFLDPLAAIAPGAYVLWQNTINSWQLWKMRRRNK